MVSKIPSPFTNPFVVVTSVRNAINVTNQQHVQ